MEELGPALVRTTQAGVRTASMGDMEDGSSYECTVSAVAGEYVSRPATITVTTVETRKK